ncbi:TonB-dependent receptor [uncultured Draconibacterium sp.]|uniref:TonB-dependent receptor n=1 Tax=uncultured Draconibacterium sp. TaxID=1573823 RepID=UPI0032175ECB
MKQFYKTLFILIITLSTISGAFAQSMVSGIISDSNGGATLPFANVIVKGTTTGTTTNLNGEFRLPLNAGTYTLVASFMGYESKEEIIEITNGQNVTVDFSLVAESILGEEVVVTAMMLGQKAAISSQLNAAGIVNAVSEKQIQELPDANAGDALGRLPGISLKRSGGEAQNIVLRGLNEKFSSIQLNGVQVPSTDGESRGVDLSMFSLSSLAGIEVTKALTADMDADAIAGSVNLVTKKASSNPETRIDLGGGYNNLEKSIAQFNLAVRYERRIFNEKLGVQASANAEQKIRSSEAYDQGWVIIDKDYPEINSLRLSYNDELRKRMGGSLLLDYSTNDGGTIRFNNFYNHSDRDFVRYSRNYGLKTAEVSYDIEDKERDIQTINNAISGENYVKKLKINWGGSHALTVGNTPYDHVMEFYEGGTSNTGIDINSIGDEEYIDIIRNGPSNRIIPYAYNNYEMSVLKTAYFKPSKSKDRDLIAYLDLTREFSLSDKISVTVKTGAKTRNKNRNNVNDVYRAYYTGMGDGLSFSLLDDGSIVDADYSNTSFANLQKFGNSVLLTNFLDNPVASREIFSGDYELTPMVNSSLAREWYATHKNGVNSDATDYEYRGHPSGIPKNYTVKEQINSAYFMTTLDLGKMFRLIGGVRIEQENNDYTAKYAPDVYGMSLITKDDVTDTTRNYSQTFILPSFHLKFKPLDWFDLRLAATKTLARPDFSMRLPNLVISRGDENTVYKGNTGLENTVAWNYDVIASLYESKYGLLTVGAFYKELDNVFYFLNDVVISNDEMVESYELPTGTGVGSYKGMKVSSPVNTDGTSVKGLEFDLQANLSFLPGFLGNFVLRGNYSVIQSTTYIPRFRLDVDRTTIPYTKTPVFYETEETLEGQPSKFGNVALGYDQGGFSARLSLFFQGDYVSSVSGNEKLDVMQKGYSKWDLALKQKIEKFNAELMLNVSNISNMEEGTYYKYMNLDRGSSIYGMLIDFGVRIKL